MKKNYITFIALALGSNLVDTNYVDTNYVDTNYVCMFSVCENSAPGDTILIIKVRIHDP